MSNHRGRDRLLSCAALCGLLFFTYGQKMEPPREPEWARKINVAVRGMRAINGVIRTVREEPDLSEESAGREALNCLIEDEGFQECVWYGMEIEEEDSREEILRKLEACDTFVLDEDSYGNGIYSLEALSLFPNLRQLTIRINEWDDSVITDFTPVSQLSRLEYLWISYGKDEEIDLSFLGQMPAITELFLTHSGGHRASGAQGFSGRQYI